MGFKIPDALWVDGVFCPTFVEVVARKQDEFYSLVIGFTIVTVDLDTAKTLLI